LFNKTRKQFNIALC